MTNSTTAFDTPAVEAWIRRTTPALVPPFTWTQLPGGHSNLTFLIQDTLGAKAVIRRPPTGPLLPKAHDMGREWSIISALGATAVPVPRAIAFCEDTSVTGAAFYVMGHVAGHTLHNATDTDAWVPQARRHAVALSFIDGLAALHAVDPDAVGLGALGPRTGYITRQLDRWYGSWTNSAAAAEYDDDRAHEVKAFLAAHVPEAGPARVVHGDYGVHNTLIGADDRIAAIIDWEIATLGEPLADLAYALNWFPHPGQIMPPNSATALPGFPPPQALAQRYAERTGARLDTLPYYSAFNFWKSAAILHGVYARYRAGTKDPGGTDLVRMRTQIGERLANAQNALARL